MIIVFSLCSQYIISILSLLSCLLLVLLLLLLLVVVVVVVFVSVGPEANRNHAQGQLLALSGLQSPAPGDLHCLQRSLLAGCEPQKR